MFLNQSYGGLDLHVGATPVLKMAPGILRGIADMGLGIIGYHLSDKVTAEYVTLKRMAILVSMMFIIFCFPHTRLDFIFAGLVMLLIVVEFSNVSTQKNRNINTMYLRKISLGIYFCHQFIILLWQYGNDKVAYLAGNVMWKIMVVYIGVVIIFASLICWIIDKIKAVKK